MLEAAKIERMSVQEKLQALEQIWASLAADENNIVSPDWHRDVLAVRKSRAERGESKFLSLDQLKERLSGE